MALANLNLVAANRSDYQKQNLNANFFLEQIAKMSQTSGDYLLGRVLRLSARA